MATEFEPVMDALLAQVSQAVQIPFTASTTAGSAIVSVSEGIETLFPGLPVFGGTTPWGTVISTVNPDAGTISLSELMTETAADLSFTTGFLTAGRRLKHWQEVKQQPAVFLRRLGTVDAAQGDGLIATTLETEIWIYSQAGKDADAVPDVTLSNLDRLVRESLLPDTEDGLFTLGGLVHWCRIEGRSDYHPGDQGPQGISRIPVRITLP